MLRTLRPILLSHFVTSHLFFSSLHISVRFVTSHLFFPSLHLSVRIRVLSALLLSSVVFLHWPSSRFCVLSWSSIWAFWTSKVGPYLNRYRWLGWAFWMTNYPFLFFKGYKQRGSFLISWCKKGNITKNNQRFFFFYNAREPRNNDKYTPVRVLRQNRCVVCFSLSPFCNIGTTYGS